MIVGAHEVTVISVVTKAVEVVRATADEEFWKDWLVARAVVLTSERARLEEAELEATELLLVEISGTAEVLGVMLPVVVSSSQSSSTEEVGAAVVEAATASTEIAGATVTLDCWTAAFVAFCAMTAVRRARVAMVNFILNLGQRT